MAYPTTSDLVADSEVAELTSLSADQQDALRAAAIIGIEEYTGQSFEEFEGTLNVRSEGGAELALPRRIDTLTGISQGDVPLEDLDAVMITDDRARLIFSPPTPNYYEQALYEISGGDYPRSFGAGFIAVTGTFGWPEVPEGVVLALRYDMEDTARADANALSPTVAIARKLGLRDVSQGNLRVALGNASTLSARTERLLAPYIWRGSSGRLV